MNEQIVADSRRQVAEKAKTVHASGRPESLVVLGEAYSTSGDQNKAIEAIGEGLKSSDLDDGEKDFARLQLGIAQFRAGKMEAARKTWGEIKSHNGSLALARAWRIISGQRLT
jgi:hypothetical protein